MQELLKSGRALREQAENEGSTTQAAALLAQAIDQFTEAAKLQPDSYTAHSLWSLCLLQRATFHPELSSRLAQIRAAAERFAVATHCPGVDWDSYYMWGTVLRIWIGDWATSTEERLLALNEARKAFEAGQLLARFAAQRASLGNELGNCLTSLAGLNADPEEKRVLYRRALGSFETASAAKADARSATADAMWGVALMQLGQLIKDQSLIREAVGKLQNSIEKNPDVAEPRYNLACCHALLDQPQDALRELRACFEKDAQLHCYKLARTDADLNSLRSLAEFKALYEQPPSQHKGDKEFEAGLALQQAAELSPIGNTAVSYYEKAIVQYSKSAQSRPDFYRAHVRWAECLMNEARLVSDMAKRRSLFAAARERFVQAAKCPGVDWKLYYVWGNMLMTDLVGLTNFDKERRSIAQEALKIFEAGLPLAASNGDRARLENQMGIALAFLADGTSDIGEQRLLYRQAIARFDSATRMEKAVGTAETHELWGAALLQLGRISNDHGILRQAMDRLKTATDLDDKRAKAHYNLACVFTLLNLPDEAIRQLRISIERDPQMRTLAADDPDLKKLRRHPDFQKLIGQSNPPPSALTQPPIKVR